MAKKKIKIKVDLFTAKVGFLNDILEGFWDKV